VLRFTGNATRTSCSKVVDSILFADFPKLVINDSYSLTEIYVSVCSACMCVCVCTYAHRYIYVHIWEHVSVYSCVHFRCSCMSVALYVSFVISSRHSPATTRWCNSSTSLKWVMMSQDGVNWNILWCHIVTSPGIRWANTNHNMSLTSWCAIQDPYLHRV